MVKNPPANAGDLRDTGLILGSGTSPRGGHGNPLHYSGLENPMDRGAWWATVRGSLLYGVFFGPSIEILKNQLHIKKREK